jgi:hypothetical protein
VQEDYPDSDGYNLPVSATSRSPASGHDYLPPGLHDARTEADFLERLNAFRADPEGALRLCAAIDIAGWSDREASEQVHATDVLVRVTRAALAVALRDDRGVEREYSGGDAILLILPSAINVPTVTRLFLTELSTALAAANRRLRPEYRVRLRIGLEVAAVIHGAAGSAAGDGVIGACRLRDSQVAKTVLDGAAGDCVVVASDFVYQKVLRPAFAAVPGWEFTKDVADVPGRYSAPCWLSLPAS